MCRAIRSSLDIAYISHRESLSAVAYIHRFNRTICVVRLPTHSKFGGALCKLLASTAFNRVQILLCQTRTSLDGTELARKCNTCNAQLIMTRFISPNESVQSHLTIFSYVYMACNGEDFKSKSTPFETVCRPVLFRRNCLTFSLSLLNKNSS